MSIPVELAQPLRGRVLVQNSPANRVPSHGVSLFALDHAIDLVPVDERGRSAPVRLRTLLRTEPPESFPGFGREVLSPVDGIVVAVHDGDEDHSSRRGLPSIGYALTQRGRVAQGWVALAGNHVILRVTAPVTRTAAGATGTGGSAETITGDKAAADAPGAVFLALCHLRRGSLAVSTGRSVRVGERLGACGNSGNSTEPHLHLQAMTAADPSVAEPLPITFPGGLPRTGAILDGR